MFLDLQRTPARLASGRLRNLMSKGLWGWTGQALWSAKTALMFASTP